MFRHKILIPLIIIVIFGCTKQSEISENSTVNPTVRSEGNNKLLDSIGYWHNQILSQTDFSHFSKESNMEFIRSNIIRTANKLNQSIFIESETERVDTEARGLLAAYLKEDELPSNSLLMIQTAFDLVVFHGKINAQISDALSALFKNRNTLSIHEQIEQIETFKVFCESEDDRRYLEAFSQVFQSSYNYWNKNPTNQKLDDEQLVVIWADAAGALYGLLLGPVGSIVEGALFSTIAAIQ